MLFSLLVINLRWIILAREIGIIRETMLFGD